jgi:D-glycero-alpha-D-manno-heptose-7-phosphate kinase
MTDCEIRARAPLRVSFGGGGTDLPQYYMRYGGAVVSAAITRYCRVSVRGRDDGATAIFSRDYGIETHFPPGTIPSGQGKLPLPEVAIEWFARCGGLSGGLELTLASDVPPGTGLGSSSAMAVALVAALAQWCGVHLDPPDIAELACRLEIDRLQLPIGKQDQHASAIGGLNTLWFRAEGVTVSPLALPAGTRTALAERLLLFSTGRSRECGTILRRQQAATGVDTRVTASLHRLKALALEMRQALLAGDLDAFGGLLDFAWNLKKRLSSGISTPQIDRWYGEARAAGALGGKITGAGGGGFLLLCSGEERQREVRAAMQSCGLTELSFDFDRRGVSVMRLTADERENRAGGMAAGGAAVSRRAFHRLAGR